MKLNVGQILYVVLNKQTAVYPMQVIEEITKKTLNGVEVDYILRGGGNDSKNSSIRLGDVDGEIFETSEKAREILTHRVVDNIQKRVDAAVAKAREWYPSSFEETSRKQEPTLRTRRILQEEKSQEEEGTVIDLGNGLTARVKLPEGFETQDP